MKRLLALSAVTFILATAGKAQITPASLKDEIKVDNKVESNIKKEKKDVRKELRKLDGKEVSYQSKQAFYADFGNVPVSKWERTDNYDKADFTKDGQLMTAYYDADTELVGTTSAKTFSDIPASARKYIDKKYPDYIKSDVVFFKDNELNETDMIMFGDQFDDADNYFVELKKDNKAIVLQVTMSGDVSFFKQIQ
jgi:hypothetical protein